MRAGRRCRSWGKPSPGCKVRGVHWAWMASGYIDKENNQSLSSQSENNRINWIFKSFFKLIKICISKSYIIRCQMQSNIFCVLHEKLSSTLVRGRLRTWTTSRRLHIFSKRWHCNTLTTQNASRKTFFLLTAEILWRVIMRQNSNKSEVDWIFLCFVCRVNIYICETLILCSEVCCAQSN